LLGASYGNTDDPLDGMLYKSTGGPPVNPVQATPWPTGTEDLASSQTSGTIWSVAEFPRKRWIWSVPWGAYFP
jgi:hypothetical protein